MKDFDIENLERRNIYKTQDDLFANVQNRVLERISTPKLQKSEPAKVFKLNWWMAAAASIVLIFGLGWTFSGSFNTTETNHIDTLVKAELPHNPKESQNAYNTLKSDVHSVEAQQKTVVATQVSHEEPKSLVAMQKIENPKGKNVKNREMTDEEVNAYLDALSSKEISEIAQNSVSDVYLDLFN